MRIYRTPFVHRATALLSLHATTVAPDAAGGGAGAPAAGTAPDDAAKAAADAAAAAAATQTPEQKAAAEKAVADKAVADKAAADKADADRVTAIKSALKLPADSGLDPAVLESTTAIASASKLSPDDAQKLLNHVASVATAHATKVKDAAIAAELQSRLPGGKVWEEQNTKWKDESLKHPDIGAGKPDQLEANAGIARRVIAAFGGSDAQSIEKFLTDSGLASHPATLGLLVRIGKAMREDQLVIPNAGAPAAPKDLAEQLWPKKKEGSA